MLTVQRHNLQRMFNHSQSHLLARAAPHVTAPCPECRRDTFFNSSSWDWATATRRSVWLSICTVSC